MKELFKKFFLFVFEWIKIIVIALVIVAPIRLLIFQPFIVKGQSMEPTLHQNDYLIIDQLTYRFKVPQRFDILVFKYPQNPSQFYVKRIVGLPGEKISIKNGKIYIYNNTFPEGFLLQEDKFLPNDLTSAIDSNNDFILKSGQYFVMGDNRTRSFDSRYWGAVDKSLIIGRVLFRIWPLNQAQAYFQ